MNRSPTAWKLLSCLILLSSVLQLPAAAADRSPSQETLVEWRFDADGQFRGWMPNGHVADATVSGGRLRGRATGSDPILLGPVFDVVATPTQQVEIRIKSSRAGAAELFWAETLAGRFGGFSQQKSVRLSIAGDGQPHVYRLRPFWHKAGHVVRLRFDPPADAVFEIESLKIVEDMRQTRSPARAWRFRNNSHGWRPDRGLVNFSADACGLSMTTTEGECTLISSLVDLDAARNPLVSVRMSVSAGTTGTIYCASSEHVGWHSVGFAVRADGRMHTYHVDMGTLAAWSGRVIMLGVGPSDAAGAAVVVESIEVVAEPRGPAELVIDYLGPTAGVNRVGRPVEIVCQVRNLGGRPATDVTVTLSVPDGVRFIDRATQAIDPVSLYLPRRATWSVEAEQAGDAAIRVRLESPGKQPATAAATFHFSRTPRLSGADRNGARGGHVPEPRPVSSKIAETFIGDRRLIIRPDIAVSREFALRFAQLSQHGLQYNVTMWSGDRDRHYSWRHLQISVTDRFYRGLVDGCLVRRHVGLVRGLLIAKRLIGCLLSSEMLFGPPAHRCRSLLILFSLSVVAHGTDGSHRIDGSPAACRT